MLMLILLILGYQELKFVFPNSTRINRGGQVGACFLVISEICFELFSIN